MYAWNVVPLCEKQLRDVNPKDVLNGGLYRHWDSDSSNCVDKFEDIFNRRFGTFEKLNDHFVVQLKGCPFHCPYCYVTPDGIHSEAQKVTTAQLVSDFTDTCYPVFHLTGGAPALYLKHWAGLAFALPEYAIFRSDFLLMEGEYSKEACLALSRHRRNLHAVSIKGWGKDEFRRNTGGVEFNKKLVWRNFETLLETNIQFFITFTGMSDESIETAKADLEKWFGKNILNDSFSIDIVHYNALD